MAIIQGFDFVVKRNHLQETKLVDKTFSTELAPNQVLLEIDTFSFTSNNITYAVLGEQMHYWNFFPTGADYGIVPAWGFADVVVSNHADVQVGQRFYGYYPMGTHLLVSIDKASPFGFVDRTEHRRELASVYNFYSNTAHDPSITPETEALAALFRPLFVTSFLIDHHLAEEDFYSASQIVITSASSKTAQALAFLLAQRKKEQGLNFSLIGLTSQQNVAFVKQLGWFDETINYNSLDQLISEEKSVVVDFTGNHSTQYDLQTAISENLVYNCLVGLVDWQHLRGEQQLPQKGEVFFAPTHAEKLQKELGVAGFQEKVGMAWQQFSSTIWSSLSIKEHLGTKELERLYLASLNGDVNPKQGNMVQLK